MWTSITQCLSPNSKQALTSPVVISRWNRRTRKQETRKQKKQLVYIEELYTPCDIKIATSSSGLYGGEVLLLPEALDIFCLRLSRSRRYPVPPCTSELGSLISKFLQCQKLRNCDLCLVMGTSSTCNKNASSCVRNFPLCKVIRPAHPSFLHCGTWSGVALENLV